MPGIACRSSTTTWPGCRCRPLPFNIRAFVPVGDVHLLQIERGYYAAPTGRLSPDISKDELAVERAAGRYGCAGASEAEGGPSPADCLEGR